MTLYSIDIQIPMWATECQQHEETVWSSPLFDTYPNGKSIDAVKVREAISGPYHLTSPEMFEKWFGEVFDTNLPYDIYCRSEDGGDGEWPFVIAISEYEYHS